MKVDILILGGGSAGYAAARTAADAGASCAVVESASELGGTCILRGCMPSKALIESANRFRVVRQASEFGIMLPGPPRIDWPAVQDRKRRLVSGFQQARVEELTSGSFSLLRGSARFVGSHRVEVRDRDEYTMVEGKRVIVATGSEPFRPPIDGLDDVPYHTSDSLLEEADLPDHLIVVGGGAVGLELAHCFEGAGARVTVVQRSDILLSHLDPDISGEVLAASRERDIRILTGHRVTEVRPRGREATVTVANSHGQQQELTGTLLIATGRKPRTEGLQLEATALQPADEERIPIDRSCRTNDPAIYAAGDCASPFPVVHLAVIQGEVAATNALVDLGLQPADHRREWSPAHRMTGVFTHPEVAQVGFSVSEAEELGIEAVAASYAFPESGRAEIEGARHGFLKLVARRDDGRLVGASAVGLHAVELIHIPMVAISQDMDVKQFTRVPHYHPTLAETWLYPAEDLAGQV